MTVPPRRSFIPAIILIVLGALLPLALTGGFQLRLAMLIWIYAIMAMGFNLLYGFTGQISLGQQGFYAIGAYAFALLQSKAQWPTAFAVPASILICAITALAIGLPLLRLRTHYLAMATLAFGLILTGVANRWIDFTGGTAGVPVRPLMIGDEPLTRMQVYFVVLAVAGVVLLLHDFIIRSHLGRALQAIRDDETAASALGVHVTKYKLRMFVLAAAIAGLAGICFSIVSLRVDPSLGEFHILVTLLTIAVVGGLGTRFGPLLGSIIVVLLPQVLTRLGELETLVYGGFVLLFLIFMPHGLSGLIESMSWRRIFRKPAASGAQG